MNAVMFGSVDDVVDCDAFDESGSLDEISDTSAGVIFTIIKVSYNILHY